MLDTSWISVENATYFIFVLVLCKLLVEAGMRKAMRNKQNID